MSMNVLPAGGHEASEFDARRQFPLVPDIGPASERGSVVRADEASMAYAFSKVSASIGPQSSWGGEGISSPIPRPIQADADAEAEADASTAPDLESGAGPAERPGTTRETVGDTASRTTAGAAPNGTAPESEAVKLGTRAARQLGMAATDFTPEALAALGRQVIVDHLLAGDLQGLLSEFEPPTRRGLARDLLVNAGLNPDRAVDGPRLVDPENPLATNDPKSAVEYLFNFDTLSATDLQRLSDRPLTPADIQPLQAKLPASLAAEFDARFDAYATALSLRTAGFLQTRIAAFADENGITLDGASVSLSRVSLRYYTRETDINNLTAVKYEKTRAEIPADGYVVEIKGDGISHRCFLSTRTGQAESIPGDGGPYAWLNAHRDTLFDRRAAAPAGDWASRVVASPMASGEYGKMSQWLSPAFRAELEPLRQPSRGRTSGEELTETLLNTVIPFREMVMKFREGDTRGAYYAYLLSLADMLFAVPDVTVLGKGVAGLGRWAGAVYRGVKHGGLGQGLRVAMAASKAPMPAWRSLDPLDADRIASALFPEHPDLARAVQQAADRARPVTVRDNWWRLPDDSGAASVQAPHIGSGHAGSAPAQAASLIEAARPIEAVAPDGTKLTVLSYGSGTNSYTMYDPITGQRFGPLLLADSAGWLHPFMPLDALERYRVGAADVLQALGNRRAGGDGTILLDERHYARIGEDYVEVAIDRAVSTPDLRIWRALPRQGQAWDIVAHRLRYNKDTGLWTEAEAAGLKGAGLTDRLRRLFRSGGAGTRTAPAEAAFQLVPDVACMNRLYDAMTNGILRSGGVPYQAEALKSFLRGLEANEHGGAVLRAMAAYYEISGRVPKIVLRRPGSGHKVKGPVMTNTYEVPRTMEWQVDVTALDKYNARHACGILRDLYKDMLGASPGASIREFGFAAKAIAKGKVPLSPNQESRWRLWINDEQIHGAYEGTRESYLALRRETRQRIVDDLRAKVQEMRFYGGHTEEFFDDVLMYEVDPIDATRSELILGSGLLETGLPPLPEDLQSLKLICPVNGIPGMDTLPKGLQYLKILGPSSGPTSAQVLIRTVFPDSLREIHVRNVTLIGMQAPLPSRLHTLEVVNCGLESLPALPAGLKKLLASRNRLTALPGPLPSRLRHMDVSHNQLIELPELPSGMMYLDASHNRLTRLPNSVANMRWGASIDVEENPFDLDYIADLRDETTARIYFSVHDGAVATQRSADLNEAIRSIFGEAHPDTIERWQAIAQDVAAGSQEARNIGEFAYFLDRLRETPSYRRDMAFRRDVQDLLVEIAKPDRQSLRDTVLGVCQTSTATCHDRIAWTMSELRKARLNDDILLGRYDSAVGDVVDIARQMFRIDVLSGIAREKVKSLTVVDELEVYLAYAVKLREDDQLGLRAMVPEMSYFGVAGITEEDLGQALRLVRERERLEFERFFVTRYEPWQDMLKRKFGARYEQVQAQLVEQMTGDDFTRKVDAKLAQDGLPLNDPETRHAAEAALASDMQYHAFLPLTKEYLASAGVVYPLLFA